MIQLLIKAGGKSYIINMEKKTAYQMADKEFIKTTEFDVINSTLK
jgi:hypothetical protein